tara:strand:- start:100 stop:234 length:135 start_codon:yes stop_codon:yes gene_type:complete
MERLCGSEVWVWAIERNEISERERALRRFFIAFVEGLAVRAECR